MHVSLTINLISSLCKEIISKQYVDINFPTLAPFHYLLQTLYDLWPTLIQENKLLIYWRSTTIHNTHRRIQKVPRSRQLIRNSGSYGI
ncbi:hypothetical protein GWI33_022603 [Rhynchophorus ferrugineus]|uniref:Uncharacterized protein n=1 Tax=Rhynchophorus ferrugineus TaxID=354439 RepID=A0A834HP40_RHYFE|nr:hypothetical protein GWI33_022603 [Rhynchophorus ferrugineus]